MYAVMMLNLEKMMYAVMMHMQFFYCCARFKVPFHISLHLKALFY